VLSGRGLCDELITRPEESYRLCCVVVCDLQTSRMVASYIYDISHLRVNGDFVSDLKMVWSRPRPICILRIILGLVMSSLDPFKARKYELC